MGSDMVVALGRATADGHTLFGQNGSGPTGRCQPLRLTRSRSFAAGERLRTQYLELPQARQAHTVLGSQPNGCWGYDHGINEHQVAVGCVPLRATLTCPGPGLLGTDLERGHTALQAVDMLTGLIERHGQGAFSGCPAEVEHDNAFLIADPVEAYVVEAAGSHWVSQEIREVRAVGNARIVRQDWSRISQGLATHAIGQGWWPADGSKLDFAGALLEDRHVQASALRRWGRTTLFLQEQNGHIDLAFLRRLLTDHDNEDADELDVGGAKDDSLAVCRHGTGPNSPATIASFIGPLAADAQRPAMAWCAFGAPCLSVYFPVFLDGELPQPFSEGVQGLGGQIRKDHRRRALAREAFARLQIRFEQETEEFMKEGAELKQRGCLADFQRQASLFMEHNVEQFEEVLGGLSTGYPLAAVSG
jgi:secernin